MSKINELGNIPPQEDGYSDLTTEGDPNTDWYFLIPTLSFIAILASAWLSR